ncbi:DUF2946 family protein [Ideonella oryzae]|uniref:DUF2946 domain-containing protein n=1 Tax=Ideonella oryzae TaxID=2937441 RepID=A0ABT1BSZ2_9BURK|nr:DUF2946 family protein [Ideonella oryzae]MCO5979329.1 hypothetical protein [Ideonella oryzae]
MAHRLTLQRFARFLLAWYVAFVGVGTLSPLFKPVDLMLVCSASGTPRWVSPPSAEDPADDPAGDPAAAAAHRHAIDCPLCLPAMAPPVVAALAVRTEPPGTGVLIPPDQRPVPTTPAGPLPARGPPARA